MKASASTLCTFRRRLLWSLGPALAVALIVLLVLGVVFVYGWLTYSAQVVVEGELQEIAAAIVLEDGTLDVERYNWTEPHHLYGDRHIDPYFVQIFDAGHRIIRASDNVRALAGAEYPVRLMAQEPEDVSLLMPLRTFRVGDDLLYYRAEPLEGPSGEIVGFVQIARFEPGIRGIVVQTALYLLLGLIPVVVTLLLIIRWVAGRVVHPLEQITGQSRALTADALDRRIDIPPDAEYETRELAVTLNRALDRLERSFLEMRRFTDNAAHQLQTPLTILQGHLEVAMRRGRSPEDYRRTMRLLRDEIESMIRMVRGLLQLARMERGVETPTSFIDLAAIVEAEVQAFCSTARTKNLGLSIEVRARPYVRATDDTLREILIPLIDNAIKYTAKGTVEIFVDADPTMAEIEVRDSGSGIAETDLPHITDRFYRGRAVAEVPGSGRGLAISKASVEYLGGSLTIRSEEACGTSVMVRLPRAAGADMAQPGLAESSDSPKVLSIR